MGSKPGLGRVSSLFDVFTWGLSVANGGDLFVP